MPRVALTLLASWHRTPGGTARAAIGQARALAETGEVDLIGVGAWGLGPYGRSPTDGAGLPIATRRFPAPQQLLYGAWHRFRWPPVQLVTGRVDIVHATTITVPPRGSAAALVVTVHDLFPWTMPDRFSERGRRVLGRGLELARDEADVVLVSSRHGLAECVAHGFSADRMQVVPLGVEPGAEVGDQKVEAVRHRLGITGHMLLWVGTIEPRKNVELLLEMMGRLSDVACTLVLAGPSGWQTELEPLVDVVADRVRLLGRVSDAELVELYAAADLVLVPSWAEGFGLTALEGMAAGTPCVVSAGSALDEVVGDTGIALAPDDLDAWVETVEQLLEDADRRELLGAAARIRSESFSWERCALATLAAYSSALGRS